MEMKSWKSVKWLRYLILMALSLISVAVAAGCGQGGDDAKRQAQTALQQLLSCTLQQAGEFNVAMVQSLREAGADGAAGLSQGSEELENYLTERFGDYMTDACIEDLAESRTFYQSIALTINFNSGIEADKIALKERSDEEESYTFSARLNTSAGDAIATAKGTISMEKDETGWKASQITLTVEEAE